MVRNAKGIGGNRQRGISSQHRCASRRATGCSHSCCCCPNRQATIDLTDVHAVPPRPSQNHPRQTMSFDLFTQNHKHARTHVKTRITARTAHMGHTARAPDRGGTTARACARDRSESRGGPSSMCHPADQDVHTSGWSRAFVRAMGDCFVNQESAVPNVDCGHGELATGWAAAKACTPAHAAFDSAYSAHVSLVLRHLLCISVAALAHARTGISHYEAA